MSEPCPAMHSGGKPPGLVDQVVDGLADCKALALCAHGPGLIRFKTPVLAPADLSGVKLRAPAHLWVPLPPGLLPECRQGPDWPPLRVVLMSTASGTSMIFLFVLGAGFFNAVLALTQMPQVALGWIVEQGFGPGLVLACILIISLILGCVMGSLSMTLLTIPIFYPVMRPPDFGMSQEHRAIRFGSPVLIVVKVGLIRPPLGMNLFVINAIDRATPMREPCLAVMVFAATDLMRVALLVMVPGITLFLILYWPPLRHTGVATGRPRHARAPPAFG